MLELFTSSDLILLGLLLFAIRQGWSKQKQTYRYKDGSTWRCNDKCTDAHDPIYEVHGLASVLACAPAAVWLRARRVAPLPRRPCCPCCRGAVVMLFALPCTPHLPRLLSPHHPHTRRPSSTTL